LIGHEGIDQALPLSTLPLLLTVLLLSRKPHQLLHGEQGAATLHQPLKALLQGRAAFAGQLAVALWHHLGSQMKTGLLHGMQQAITQDLEIESQLAI
jgi:hypothetical protein